MEAQRSVWTVKALIKANLAEQRALRAELKKAQEYEDYLDWKSEADAELAMERYYENRYELMSEHHRD